MVQVPPVIDRKDINNYVFLYPNHPNIENIDYENGMRHDRDRLRVVMSYRFSDATPAELFKLTEKLVVFMGPHHTPTCIMRATESSHNAELTDSNVKIFLLGYPFANPFTGEEVDNTNLPNIEIVRELCKQAILPVPPGYNGVWFPKWPTPKGNRFAADSVSAVVEEFTGFELDVEK